MRRVASIAAALILAATAPLIGQEHGGHPPAKSLVMPEKPTVAPEKPVVVPVKSVTPAHAVPTPKAPAVPTPKAAPIAPGLSARLNRAVQAARARRPARVVVQWPSTDVHWQVQWPTPSDRATLKWPETAAVTDQAGTD